jgi:hypothetical protein
MRYFVSYFFSLFLVPVLFLLSGCIKYYDLLPSEFPQAQTKKLALAHVTHSIKDVQFYSQFSTEALFNVIWKSPKNSKLLLDIYASRRGMSKTRKEAILKKNQRQHAENVTMFVLAYVKDQQRPDLQDIDSTWTMFLQAQDGFRLAPLKIKPMDMTPELATIFEKRNTNFKQLYVVKFPRKYTIHTQNEQGVDKETTIDLYDDENLTLVINSVELEEKMSWKVAPELLEDFSVTETNTQFKETENNEDCDWL